MGLLLFFDQVEEYGRERDGGDPAAKPRGTVAMREEAGLGRERMREDERGRERTGEDGRGRGRMREDGRGLEKTAGGRERLSL